MKRVLVILLVLLAFFVPTMGQKNPLEGRGLPKDSLPDLWVVTIDMSRSMLNYRQGLASIPERINRLLSSDSLVGKNDVFILQRSGAEKKHLLNVNEDDRVYSDISLVSDLIHKREVFGKKDGLTERLRQLVGDTKLFEYDMSFTSLVRPLSIYKLVLDQDVDFILFNKIYHILITDDGDINDQWMQDYKWMKKWAKKHFSRDKEILPTIASSEFDFTSRKSGKFIEITTIDEQQPHIYLTQYVTFQECYPEDEFSVDWLFEVAEFHNDHFTLHSNLNEDIIPVRIDTCVVNGRRIGVNRNLYLSDMLKVPVEKSVVNPFYNTVTLEGSYQEYYFDRVLGPRYRTVAYNGQLADNFVPVETRVFGQRCLLVAFLTALAILLFVVIWRNCVVLHIYANGKHYAVKRKAMKKMRNDDFTLLTLVYDEQAVTGASFYKGVGIRVCDDDEVKKGKKKVVISSHRVVNPDCSGIIIHRKNHDKNISFEFDGFIKDKVIQFSYNEKLSHNLIIKLVKEKVVENQDEKNILRAINFNMLASYYEQNMYRINTPSNNVEVNIIRKEMVGGSCANDFAVLNIYNLNSQGSADRIFLRYSMMCLCDSSQTGVPETMKKLLKIARYVLRSERQKKGFFEKTPFVDQQSEKTRITVDAPPLLNYLYLIKKTKSRLVYSPFKDGRPPLSNGQLGLTRKAIKIFPNSVMMLLSLPIKYKNPSVRKDVDPTAVSFNPCRRKMETLYFYGNDTVELLNQKADFSDGRKCPSMNGVSYTSWDLDDVIFRNIIK